MNNLEAPKKKPRCDYISKIGARCQADPQTGKTYCIFHDPDQKKKQAEARKHGGEARSRQSEPELMLPPNLPARSLDKASDICGLLMETINHIRCGQIDLRAVKTIAYLSSLLLRAVKNNTQPEIAEILADTINRFRCGQIELPAAKAIGHLASIMLAAVKQAMLEEQAASASTATRPAHQPRSGGIETMFTPVVPKALKEQEKELPHVAIGLTVNTAAHPEVQSST